jgi:hypothetical protein
VKDVYRSRQSGEGRRSTPVRPFPSRGDANLGLSADPKGVRQQAV